MNRTMLSAVAALAALAVQAPASASASADAAVPGTVTGTDRSLVAGCHYVRTVHMEYGDIVELTAFAVAGPDADVWVRCTVTSRFGSATASGSGFNVAQGHGRGSLADGPTTVCVEATAYRTVDVQMRVNHCQTHAN